ncbi:MAG TPA: PilZ domain-containing protein [Thermoanaerobaculia bacterium]|nr:PilZ domain-containing protein [Thermoanaerobaculia bacterium]
MAAVSWDTDEASLRPRGSERHLLVPAVDGSFGEVGVALKDLSTSGARLRSNHPLEAGSKSVLQFDATQSIGPVSLEALVVWSQPVTGPEESGRYVSGVKLFGEPGLVGRVIESFGRKQLSVPIEECRRSARFVFPRTVPGEFGAHGTVRIEDLSSRGARIETSRPSAPGTRSRLRYVVPEWPCDVSVEAEVIWCHLKAVWSDDENRYSVGLRVTERRELQRAAIGRFIDLGMASQETRSLRLKQRIQALEVRHQEPLAVGEGDRRPLIDAVRRELERNGAARERWNAKAQTTAAEPSIRGFAGPIAGNLDALAVWEYLDRTVDPTLVSRAFAP